MSHTHVDDHKTQESKKQNEKSAERKREAIKRKDRLYVSPKFWVLLILLIHVFQMFPFFRSGKMKSDHVRLGS